MTETTVTPEAQALAAAPIRSVAPGVFDVDRVHTSIGFVARHLMVAKVRGYFTDFSGSIVIADDPLLSAAAATISTSSINTASERRDGHLRSADFFDCDQHPAMTFRSTTVLPHDSHAYTVLGDLTIKGQARPVELEVEFNGQVIDPWGNQRIAVSATAEIDRRDFGLTWNVPLAGGGLMVGNTIRIEIDAEAVRQSS